MGSSVPDSDSTIDRARRTLDEELRDAGVPDAQTASTWILCYVTGLDSTGLIVHGDDLLTEDQRQIARECYERRVAGEPLQYIVGSAPFRFIELKTRRGVFIPRPETEVLVDEALSMLDRMRRDGLVDGPPRILDLCCGSGTIALSIASEVPDADVVAVDVSPSAVELTRENSKSVGVEDRVEVLEGDLFSPLGAGESFHLVLSNPPYVPQDKLAVMPHEVVDWEPVAALDGGPDGLDIFRRILDGIDKHLVPGGYLICELDEDMLDESSRLCNAAGDGKMFCESKVVKDLTGRDRILRARRSF
ncbi:MAG: peptide chain release factor N(5)-glutamine methyltransferase [Coriobacteriales bacterium]|jgi:release factor glutamine methyltransferase